MSAPGPQTGPGTAADATIRHVLTTVRTIAVVGASANAQRPSFAVMRFLLARGYRVIPVNPGHAGSRILGETCFADLAGLPEPVDMIDIFRNSEAVAGIVDDALRMALRPAVIWTQLGVRDEAAARRAEAEGLTVIMDRCPAIEYPRLVGAGGGLPGTP